MGGQKFCSSVYILCYMCQFDLRLDEWEIMSHAICSSHDIENTKWPLRKLLFLYDKIVEIRRHIKNLVAYPNIQLAIRSVPHSTELRIPPLVLNLEDDGNSKFIYDQSVCQEETGQDFLVNTTESHQLTHAGPYDLVSDLNLSIRQADVNVY